MDAGGSSSGSRNEDNHGGDQSENLRTVALQRQGNSLNSAPGHDRLSNARSPETNQHQTHIDYESQRRRTVDTRITPTHSTRKILAGVDNIVVDLGFPFNSYRNERGSHVDRYLASWQENFDSFGEDEVPITPAQGFDQSSPVLLASDDAWTALQPSGSQENALLTRPYFIDTFARDIKSRIFDGIDQVEDRVWTSEEPSTHGIHEISNSNHSQTLLPIHELNTSTGGIRSEPYTSTDQGEYPPWTSEGPSTRGINEASNPKRFQSRSSEQDSSIDRDIATKGSLFSSDTSNTSLTRPVTELDANSGQDEEFKELPPWPAYPDGSKITINPWINPSFEPAMELQEPETPQEDRAISEYTTINKDWASSAINNFVINPQSYRSEIARLEKLVFDLGTDIIHISLEQQDYGGYNAVFHAALPHDDTVRLDDSQRVLCLLTQELLQKALAIFHGLIMSLQEFVDIGFSNCSYNIICADPERRWVLRVMPISISSLRILRDLIQEGLKNVYDVLEGIEQQFVNVTETITDLSDAVAAILDHLGLSSQPIAGTPSPTWERSSRLDSLLPTASVLFMGLVSFIQSHVGDVDASLLVHKVNEIVILGTGSKFYFSRQDLSCLNGLTKGPVWALSSFPVGLNRALYLSVAFSDLLTLWGPLRLEDQDSFPQGVVSGIGTSGGSIRKLTSLPTHLRNEDIRPEEELCHWFGWTDDINHEEVNSQNRLDLRASSSQRLLIGVPIEGPLRSNGLTTSAVHVCECSSAYWNSCESFNLGTAHSFFTRDSMAVQLSIAKIVGGAVTGSWKVHPRTTLKDAILNDWLPSSNQSMAQTPHLEYLDYDTVLEISACSGIYRRISIWDLFKSNSRILSYLNQRLQEGQDIKILVKERSHHAKFVAAWKTMTQDQKDIMLSGTKLLLQDLRLTGVEPKTAWEDTLKAWDVSYQDDIGRIGRRTTPRWAIIAKDSEIVASFVVMTEICLKDYVKIRNGFVSKTRASAKRHPSWEILRTNLRISASSLNSKLHVDPDTNHCKVPRHLGAECTANQAEKNHSSIRKSANTYPSARPNEIEKSSINDDFPMPRQNSPLLDGLSQHNGWKATPSSIYRRPVLQNTQPVPNDLAIMESRLEAIKNRRIQRRAEKSRSEEISAASRYSSKTAPSGQSPPGRPNRSFGNTRSPLLFPEYPTPVKYRAQTPGMPNLSSLQHGSVRNDLVITATSLLFRGSDNQELGILRLGPDSIHQGVHHVEWQAMSLMTVAAAKMRQPRGTCTEFINHHLAPNECTLQVDLE